MKIIKMRNLYWLILLLFAAQLYSCKEFIELPVTDTKVIMNAPGENLETDKYTQLFWWEPVEDATAYRLQIVNPNFENITSLVLDTLSKSNKITYTLDPGQYQWRVRAENSSSTGVYTTRNFTVHESSIEDQQVQIQTPANGLITNQANITFKWMSLFGADNYTLQVDNNNFLDENNMVFNQKLSTLEYRLLLTQDGFYQWRVRAENSDAESKWSAVQSFTFDSTPPTKVLLASPAADYVGSKPVTLKWNAVTGAAKYQLMVYKANSSSPYNSTFPLTLNTLSYSFNLGEYNETLYFSVKAVDEAGNIGEESEIRRFTVQ